MSDNHDNDKLLAILSPVPPEAFQLCSPEVLEDSRRMLAEIAEEEKEEAEDTFEAFLDRTLKHMRELNSGKRPIEFDANGHLIIKFD